LSGKRVVIIIGGGSGIGRAAVLKFLSEGSIVCACDINKDRLDQLKKYVNENGDISNGNLHTYELNVTKVNECENVINAVLKDHSQIDVLTNCAGISIIDSVENMGDKEWDSMVDVNLKGTFFMCRFAIPSLEKTKGAIINMSSCSGILGGTHEVIYSATKGGIITLTKALAVELASRNIRVNTIAPGDVETNMFVKNAELTGQDMEGFKKELLAEYPGGTNARLGQPEEIAEIIYFLSSPKVGIISGAVVSADGGFAAGY
jgi:NAD(P)-dependent dehydrogenase (short-subunit alcohol dehydrogenase family)